jgi:hypothetical protein
LWLAALLFELYGFRNNSAAWRYSPRFRRASSLVTVVPKKTGLRCFLPRRIIVVEHRVIFRNKQSTGKQTDELPG